MRKIIFSSSIFFILFIISTIALAETPILQDETQEPFLEISENELNTLIQEQDAQQSETIKKSYIRGESASCFDYYSFGSIDVNLSQDQQSYSAGDPVLIRGTITNKNSYPVVGLDIKARLVKDVTAAEQAQIMILDEFDIVENIVMAANGEYELSYSHILPLNAPSGKYQLYFYAVEQDKFNLSGLSFTNDIVASQISFDVEGGVSDHIYLDQSRITIGDKSYNVMESMTQYLQNFEIPVSIPLYNPSDIDTKMSVTYTLYSWDSANPKNQISIRTEEVLVPAKSEKMLTYSIEDESFPVYYLSIKAEPVNSIKDTSVFREKTISNIRLAMQDISLPRLSFVTTNKYPLKAGELSTLVTCFQNTNENDDMGISKIETVLIDDKGREITRTVYEGKTSADMMAIIQKFNPKRSLSNFTILSTIYDSKNNVIDVVEKKYSCTDINPDLCSKSKPIVPLVFPIVLMIIIGLGIVLFKRKDVTIERV